MSTWVMMNIQETPTWNGGREEKQFSKETEKGCSDTLRKPSTARPQSQENKILGTKRENNRRVK